MELKNMEMGEVWCGVNIFLIKNNTIKFYKKDYINIVVII